MSECLGVKWIGFILAIFGVVGTVCAVASGRLVKYLPRFVLVHGALFASIGIIVAFLLLKREKSYYEIITYAVVLGGSEAVINAVIPGMIHRLLCDCYNNAKVV